MAGKLRFLIPLGVVVLILLGGLALLAFAGGGEKEAAAEDPIERGDAGARIIPRPQDESRDIQRSPTAGASASAPVTVAGTPAGTETATRASSPTAASRTASATRTATRAAGGATVTRTPTAVSGATRDLSKDEKRGGHTLERHVGKSDADLRARLKAEPDISAASSYKDRATAEKVVALALADGKRELDAWLKRTGSRPNLVLRYDAGFNVGRSLDRGASSARDVTAVVVVLKYDSKGYFVLTSYPQAPR
ncbi:hypothetical protein AYO38_09565 [bacterium SCGC AG-212-C10]|nr:hypothetical protein AYO38_09565 [bacterium SCGC AG-212-C10]